MKLKVLDFTSCLQLPISSILNLQFTLLSPSPPKLCQIFYFFDRGSFVWALEIILLSWAHLCLIRRDLFSRLMACVFLTAFESEQSHFSTTKWSQLMKKCPQSIYKHKVFWMRTRHMLGNHGLHRSIVAWERERLWVQKAWFFNVSSASH